MVAVVHRPLKIIAFNANGTGRQAYEVRIHVARLKNRCSPLFRDASENSYEVLHSKL
jgi:hypothetical protein